MVTLGFPNTTQPREYNWGATWKKKWWLRSRNWEFGRRDPSRWQRGSLYPQKLALSSPTSDGSSVGIVRSRTRSTEFKQPYKREIVRAQYPNVFKIPKIFLVRK
jgi:hypothetical protein